MCPAVTDARGNPALDATVVVFPANEKLWTYQSRFIRRRGRIRTEVSGCRAAQPGSHLAVAIQGLEDGQAGDPEFGSRSETAPQNSTWAKVKRSRLTLDSLHSANRRSAIVDRGRYEHAVQAVRGIVSKNQPYDLFELRRTSSCRPIPTA